MTLLVLNGVAEPDLGSRLCCLATPGWHAPLVLRSSWSLFIFWWRKWAILHLMQVNSVMKILLNGVALVGIMLWFPTGIADNTRTCTGVRSVIRVVVVGKIFPWPPLQLLMSKVPKLVPTPLHTPLFIVELVLLLGRPFYVDRNVVHVLI